MFKQALIFLADADAAPQVLGKRWALRPTLVIGRQHAVHLTLDAAGVPWRQTAAYARLQVPRLAPFASADGVFLRQGPRLHVWLWPAALVQQALKRAGWSDGRAVQVLPESLWVSAPRSGTVLQPCATGAEALRFVDGQLAQTQWWPEAPGAAELAAMTAGSDVTRTSMASQERLRQRTPWTWRTSALGLQTAAESATRQKWTPGLAWVVAGGLGLGMSLAYGAWVLRESWVLAQAKTEVQAQLDDWLQSRQAKGGARTSPVAAQDAQWLRAVREATRGVQLEALLQRLAGPLAARGLQVHELVVERDSVKVALVSGYGGVVDLDLAVSALEQAGPWEQLELLDTANTAQPRFAWKLSNPSKGAS